MVPKQLPQGKLISQRNVSARAIIEGGGGGGVGEKESELEINLGPIGH
jgi:hypothetical protein